MICLAATIFCLRIGAYLTASRRMFLCTLEFGTIAFWLSFLGVYGVAAELNLVFDVANRCGFSTSRRLYVAFAVFAVFVGLTSLLWAWALRTALQLLGY